MALSCWVNHLTYVVYATSVCRKTIVFLKMSANLSSTSGSINSKILLIMEEIISITKALDILSSNEDRAQLNRLLYRSMDQLVVLKCQLLQLQVSLLSKPTSLNPSPVFEDPILTDQPTSEKTSSSTSIPGKMKSRPPSPVDLTQEPSTSSWTRKETQVNPHSVNTWHGTIKSQSLDGDVLETSCILPLKCLTVLPIYLTSHVLNPKTGVVTISLQRWKESKTDYSSTPNMNAPKSS